jgi:Abnormal spindle-like microcephaly-assoc'd, ASPM-SPD-2-Hydin/Protein of unknown function (DUF1573)
MKYGQAQTVRTQVSRERNNQTKFGMCLLLCSIAGLSSLLGGCTGIVTSAKPTNAVASFQVNPANVSFGQVVVGKQATQQVALANTGNMALNITQITISDPHFSVAGTKLPLAVAVGQSTSFTVAVDATVAGNVTGTLTAQGDAGSAPVVAKLSATAVNAPSAALSLSAANINFGSVAVGSKGTTNLVLTNSGTAALTISMLSLSGAEFTVSGTTTPQTIAAGQSAQLALTFSPTASGSATGSLTITSSDSTNPTVTIPLSGTGTAVVQPGLTISPASFNFGSIVDGETKSETITVTNPGTAAVSIADLSVSGSAYSVSGLVAPVSVAAGSSASFTVLFAPTTAGNQSGTVSVISNSPNSPNILSLNGTGTAATVTLSASPSNLSFASINAGSSSSKSVTISNTGNTSLTVSQVSVSAKDFKVSGMSTPVTLAAGQNTAMTVSFSPTASENITGNITVTSSQGASAVIAVSGSGLQPALTLTPSSASFGNVTEGSPATQTVQLANSGTGTLTISQVSVAGSGFSTGTLSLPITLSSGQASNFNVEFNPTAAGAITGSVTIVSNAPNSPAVIGLSGTGVAATQTLAFSATSLSFGSVDTGSSSSQNVTITNSGNTSVTISQISESGTGFTLSGTATPVTLTAGQKMTFSVEFSPSSTGSDTGTVTVTSNATGSPATVSLSGTGVSASHTATLTWTASTSTVSGYNVYRSTTSGSGYAKMNSGLVAAVTYSDTAVENGVTYYYVVTAVDSSGDESVYSNQAMAVIP